MAKSRKPRFGRKSQDEKDLERLAKKLLSMPHKPREQSKIAKHKPGPDRAKRRA